MRELRELYQEVIIDHSRHPRNFATLSNASCQAEGFNPLCGDKITLYIKLENNVITHVCFQGSGCAISTASASLMTEQLKGKTSEEAREIFHAFHQLLTEKTPTPHEKIPNKLMVLSGVRDYPSRIKCATLAWHAFQAAMNHQQTASTEVTGNGHLWPIFDEK